MRGNNSLQIVVVQKLPDAIQTLSHVSLVQLAVVSVPLVKLGSILVVRFLKIDGG